MNDRPQINLSLSSFDKWIEVLGWLALLAIWILSIYQYFFLPDEIPIHFNLSGEPDNYGSKGFILSLPVIASLLFLGLTALNNYPHLFNYPSEITQENAEVQYRLATRLIRILKFSIVLIFLLLAVKVSLITNSDFVLLGPFLMPVILGLVFIPIGRYLYQLSKVK
ncbi:MAG: DUF1648 domain-containing protein [Salibacter sp.]|uniref:DUF1648 domain-containing protein n=1 Tax=Salibacter sp. TaxID=2010995 RepID=UPI00286FE5E9|nr:DUF1648 domain-containing protein [Salibacter sp.]MDR9398545.1 DUF1648 domain-containing protein [Salibacter sp.]